MRTPLRSLAALAAVLLLAAIAAGTTTGCAAPALSTSGCTTTAFISPTSVTLDHTVKGNAQTFTTGYQYSGSSCAIPALSVLYNWNVSDTIDATVSSTGAVSCVNASLAPITVYSSLTTYSGTPLVPTNTPTNLPTATLTCK